MGCGSCRKGQNCSRGFGYVVMRYDQARFLTSQMPCQTSAVTFTYYVGHWR